MILRKLNKHKIEKHVCHGQGCRYIGDKLIPPFNRNPFNGNNGSLDPGTFGSILSPKGEEKPPPVVPETLAEKSQSVGWFQPTVGRQSSEFPWVFRMAG